MKNAALVGIEPNSTESPWRGRYGFALQGISLSQSTYVKLLTRLEFTEPQMQERSVMRTKGSFDTKCYELAEYFMSEPASRWRKEDVNELAELIQSTIEDFLREDQP